MNRPFLDTPVNDLLLESALVTLVVVLRLGYEPSYDYAVFSVTLSSKAL